MEQQYIKWLIGEIDACIGGDLRYSTTIKVYLVGNPGEMNRVEIYRSETNAAGGMDGPGGSWNTGMKLVATQNANKPAEVIKFIKHSFDDTIRRYGKPTKRFMWFTEDDGGENPQYGLSAKLCAAAIANARG
jgi:hypothetical protein